MKRLLIFILLFTSYTTFAQVKVNSEGDIIPTGIYPALKSTNLKGTLHSFKTIIERDALPLNYRDTGMLAYVVDLNKYYHLVGGIQNINWQEFVLTSNEDGLISGGIVSWSGSGLTFNIQAAVFRIFGMTYYTRDTTITLDPADPTYSRIDLFALDTTNGGEVIKITGTPSPTPVAPQVTDAQIALTTGITLNVGDTVPSNMIIKSVYDENTEWITDAQHGTHVVDFNNTANPYHLSKAIYLSKYSNCELYFVDGAFNPNQITQDGLLDMWVYLNSSLGSNNIYVSFFNNQTFVGRTLLNSNYGFNKNDSNHYVHIVIPFNLIRWSGNQFTTIELEFRGSDTSGTEGLYIDYIRLQTGINNIPSPTDYSNKADSTTTKKLNDSTYVGLYWVKGIPYQKGDTIKIHSIATVGDIDVLQNTIDSSSFGIKKLGGTVKNVVIYADGLTGIGGNGTQVNSDWNATSGVAAILNKPTLFSGSYTDLTNKPTIPAPFNPIAGTNMTITGTYPNITFNSTASGGTTERFGIEDNTGLQDRTMNMQKFGIAISNSKSFNFSTNNAGSHQYGILYIDSSSAQLSSQNYGSANQGAVIQMQGASSTDSAFVQIAARNYSSLLKSKEFNITPKRFMFIDVPNSTIPNNNDSMIIPHPGLSASHFIPISITDGTGTHYSDSTGNITISSGGGSTYTASNGLTMSGSDVQLGGTFASPSTLLHHSYITNNGFTLNMSESGGNTILSLNNSGGGVGLLSQSGSNAGVWGVSTSGTGVVGQSQGNGYGLNAQSANSYGIYTRSAPASGNSVFGVLMVDRYTTGTVANGIGASIDISSLTSTSSRISNQVVSKWTDVTDATRTSEFSITGVNNAVTNTLLKISGAGVFTLVQGLTNYTDNAAAISGGLTVGQLYRNGDIVQIVH